MEEQKFWRRCSVCKKEINFSSKYYVCSVSSCSKKRAPTQFCSVTCWDNHNAVLNHKNAGADEEHSPSKAKWLNELKTDISETNMDKREPKRIIVGQSNSTNKNDIPKEILVVVSKLKAYISASSGFNTSADVMPVLSDLLRYSCDQAIENARRDDRKTVMARDFK